MKNLSTLTALALTILIGACTKDESKSGKTNSNQSKILGKWTPVNYIDKITFSGQDQIDTIQPEPGEYVEFKNNGIMYTFTTTLDSGIYSLENDRMTIINAGVDTYRTNITTLTSDRFSYHFSETYNNVQYEFWRNFKR